MQGLIPLLLVCALVGGGLLSKYNKARTGILLGIFLGPIGLLVAAVMRNDESQEESAEKQQVQLANLAAMSVVDCPSIDDW